MPALFVSIAAAVEGVRRLVQPLSSMLAGAVTVALLIPPVYPVAATPPVYLREHMKPILAHIEAKRRAGDVIYVYYAAAFTLSGLDAPIPRFGCRESGGPAGMVSADFR